MRTAIADVRYAVRVLRRDRHFTIAALLALTLATGMTTAVFSVIYGVLLRPLPYPEPDRLVRIYEEHPGAPKPPGDPQMTNTTLNAWSAKLAALEAIAPYGPIDYTVGLPDGAVRLHGADVGAGIFSILRASPALGRFIAPGENVDGASRVVVLSDRLWRERFGGKPDVIGRSIPIDGTPHRIVGIARPGFRFPDDSTLLWRPYVDPTVKDPTVQGGVWMISALGRLKARATPAQASAEGTTLAQRLTRPPVTTMLLGVGGPIQVRVDGLADEMTSAVRGVLVVVGASVAFVLLLACANVSNLFLSRGVARQREFALRSALGAARRRLAQQLAMESLVLAACGSAGGLVLAAILIDVVNTVAPANFPRLHDVHLDRVVMLFAAGLTGVTTLLTGLLPAIRGTSFDLSASLHGGDGAIAGGFRGVRARRLRDALMVVEAAVAVVLIVGAALFARSFERLLRVDPGYDPDGVVVAQVFPPADATAARLTTITRDVVQRVRALPGVTSAGAGNMMPFSDSTYVASVQVPPPPGGDRPARAIAYFYQVTPGYIEALGVRLVAGRLLDDRDDRPEVRHVVVNEEFVRRSLGSRAAVGQVLPQVESKPPIEIVGVVSNVLKDGRDNHPTPEIYAPIPAAAPITYELDLVVRTSGDSRHLGADLARVVREVDAQTVVGSATPLADRLSASVAQPRFATLILLVFALLAVTLAAHGLYGVLSYAVSQRRRELSIRAALGAERATLIALVVREGLTVTTAGIFVGLVLAGLLSRLVQGFLFGVSGVDALAYAAAPVVIVPVAIAACILPAVRAAAAEPAAVLRAD